MNLLWYNFVVALFAHLMFRSCVDTPGCCNAREIAHFSPSGVHLYLCSSPLPRQRHSFTLINLPLPVSRFTSTDNPSRQRRRGDSPGRATMDANLFRISVTPHDQWSDATGDSLPGHALLILQAAASSARLRRYGQRRPRCDRDHIETADLAILQERSAHWSYHKGGLKCY